MVTRIVSGGQTGVDRAAIDVANELNIPHGGWCPKGRVAEDGPIHMRYNLQETATSDYAQRTELNVKDSDGTLILNMGELSGGTALTARIAERMKKPFLVVQLDQMTKTEAAATITRWLQEYTVKVLNVAGPRASKCPTAYSGAKEVLAKVLIPTGNLGIMNSRFEVSALPPRLVVVLGAGASYGARGEPKPPLGPQLLNYATDFMEAAAMAQNDRRRGFNPLNVDGLNKTQALIEDALGQGLTFEQLVTKTLERSRMPAHDQDVKNLNLVIAGAFSGDDLCARVDDAFLEHEDAFDVFLAGLSRLGYVETNIAFVTLNYDLLLEQAIQRSYRAANLFFPDSEQSRGLRVYKIHGSVDWWAKMMVEDVTGGRPVSYTVLATNETRYTHVERIDRPCLHMNGYPGEPVMAHYAVGKPGFVNIKELQRVRELALEEVKRAEAALVVGVHIPDRPGDDPALDSVLTALGSLGKAACYICGRNAGKDAERAEAYGFKIIEENWEELLERDGLIQTIIGTGHTLEVKR